VKTILHAIDTYGPGGAETVCVELASGLDRARFRSCGAVVREGWVFDTMAARGLDPALVRPGRGPVDLLYLARLVALARRRRADLIQSHLLTANLYGALAAALLRRPAIATFHGTGDVAADDARAAAKLRLIAACSFRMVFVSETLRGHYLARHEVDRDRTAVVPNGIDAATFAPAPHRRLRAELGVPDDALLVGLLGNIREAKAYDELLRVADAVRDAEPRIHFAVAGKERRGIYEDLIALRQRLRLEDRVTFLGYRTDAADLLNGLDLLLSTSTTEGMPLGTLQAMACGLPVVSTRSGGPQEVIDDGRDGLLVPVGDTAAIAAAVLRLARDGAARRTLGDRARRTVLERFTLQTMVAAYSALYDEALAP
jgi:glycosyltransferase involved in cell wall biosynthesis